MRNEVRSALAFAVLLLLGGLKHVSFAQEATSPGFFELLEAGRFSEAEKAIQTIEAKNTSMANYLKAQLRFHQQDYGQAETLLTTIKGDSNTARQGEAFLKLVRDTKERTRAFQTFSTDHFQFRYKPGKDALLTLYAGEALEIARQRISEDLGATPTERVIIEIYPAWRDFIAVSTLTETEVKTSGTVALCKFHRLMVTTPRALIRGYDWIDTLTHELSHLVINHASSGLAPVWLHEGIAKYEEVRWRQPRGSDLSREITALLQRRLEKNTLIPFEKMHPSIAKLKNAEEAALAFAQVFYFVRYLVEVRGTMAELRSVLALISKGRETQGAIASAYRVPFANLYTNWLEWLKQQPLPKEKDVEITEVEFSDGDSSKEKEDAHDLRQLKNDRARDLVRIGDLLSKHGREKAALEEFIKADRELESQSSFVLQKVSVSALHSNRRDLALASLNRAILIDPDYSAAWVHRGALHLKSGNLKLAERDFLEANALNPFDPQIHLGLREVYEKQNDNVRLEREKKALKFLDYR